MKINKTIVTFFALFGISLAISLAVGRIDSKKLSAVKPNKTAETQSPDRLAKRIICMTPAITEAVFTLGCGEQVVAVANFCTYPPQAASKPQIGGFINPNFERLSRLEPDLIIVQGRAEKIRRFCNRRRIAVLELQISDLASIYVDLLRLGRALGCADRAVALCEKIRAELEDVRSKVAHLPPQSVFLCIGRMGGSLNNLHTLGANSRFLRELIEVAGGEDIFEDVAAGYPEVSKETILKRQPDVIIEPHPAETLDKKTLMQITADWQAMGSLSAIQNGRIYFPTDDFLLMPSVRIGLTARRLAEMIHPEITANGR